jgi:hypothetical protein
VTSVTSAATWKADKYEVTQIIEYHSNLVEILGLGRKHRGDVEFGHGLRQVINTG